MKLVVFIDIQNDFILGNNKNQYTKNVIPNILLFAKYCINKKYKLYATRDSHEKIIYEYEYLLKKDLNHINRYECSFNWMIYDPLYNIIKNNVTIINKSTSGSFDLAEIIQEDTNQSNIDEIMICGFYTSQCILSNAVILQNKFPNSKITIIDDLCADELLENHNLAIKIFNLLQINVQQLKMII